MSMRRVIMLSFLFCCQISKAQQPRYTIKKFVQDKNLAEFKDMEVPENGFYRSYSVTTPVIMDIDDDSTTLIKGVHKALLCTEGQMKNKKWDGVVKFYLIDSLNHDVRYKIWEQTYKNGYLNGIWRTYALRGVLLSIQTFKNDSLDGVSRNYWIDGKTTLDEKYYFNGSSNYLHRKYYENGKLQSETPIKNGKLEGIGKKYYETGTLQETAEFRNDLFDGRQKYYYPNGQLWIELVHKKGREWTAVANYTSKGKRRDAGTLHNGNGTLILYNDDGSVDTITRFKDGIRQE